MRTRGSAVPPVRRSDPTGPLRPVAVRYRSGLGKTDSAGEISGDICLCERRCSVGRAPVCSRSVVVQFSADAAALSVATPPALPTQVLRYYTAKFANVGDAWRLHKSRRIPPNADIAKLVFFLRRKRVLVKCVFLYN